MADGRYKVAQDMALKHVMINDIIAENSARMHNLKKYYPFFALSETTFSQYKEGKYAFLDMGYITMASLRFFINENNFHEKDITYDEYEAFLTELLRRDFDVDEDEAELKQLILYIFDKLKNDGRAFEFKFYDPEVKQSRIARVKLIDSRISEGNVYYYITAEGIEFYLDTKEVKDESRINVSQLLLEKMISSSNFKGGIDVVRRINSQVIQLTLEKEKVLKMLGMDIFEGNKAYEAYMDTTAKWFSEEQKLFAKNKALVDKAIERASYEKNENGGKPFKALEEISQLENELKKTIYNHSRLIAETMELTKLADSIISRAKLRKLRPVFDFRRMLGRLMEEDKPEAMSHILMPFFMPALEKSFSMKSIDNMLLLRSDDREHGEKVEKKAYDADFCYDDELLDKKIGKNFTRLFVELMDQLKKWNKVSLKELNGIYEIKFGNDIYMNRDYYAFLVHLAGKRKYCLDAMLLKQDTLLEEMVVAGLTEDEIKDFEGMEFTISFDEREEIELELPKMSVELDGETVIKDREQAVVTNMIFERRNG